MQRVGNIVTHQIEPMKVYDEGFMVDKRQKPAVFINIEGGEHKEIVIPHITIKEDSSPKHLSNSSGKKKKVVKKRRHFFGRKTNWENKHKNYRQLGILGEEFVYEYERRRVSVISPDQVSMVEHVSQTKGDGLGHDVASVGDDGCPLMIEVKTTTGGRDNPFYMSNNEIEFFRQHRDENAVIYRVYNFDKEAKTGNIDVITASELLE